MHTYIYIHTYIGEQLLLNGAERDNLKAEILKIHICIHTYIYIHIYIHT